MFVIKNFFKKPLTINSNYIPADSGHVFPHLNIDDILKNISVESLAAEAALKKQPSTDCFASDANERMIALPFHENIAFATNKISDTILGYNRRISEINLDADFENIKHHPENIIHQTKRNIGEFSDLLSNLKNQKDTLQTEFVEFKTRNNLNRDAKYPDSLFFHYSLLPFILIIESILNGYFFAKGHDFGLIGGTLQAFIVAFLNVMSAFYAGKFVLPYINHNNTKLRTIGLLSVPMYLSWALTFNCLVAHYRDQLGILSENAAISAITSFAHSPFHFYGFDSWLLFFLGILFSVIALLDGYKSDDKYPGFGELTRKLRRAEDDYYLEKQNIINKLGKLHEAAIYRMSQVELRVRSRFDELSMLIQMKRQLIREFPNYVDYVEKCCDVVIKKYREYKLKEHNKLRRITAPTSYFDEHFVFSNRPSLPKYGNETCDDESLRSARDKIEQISITVRSGINRLHEMYIAFSDSLKDNDDYLNRKDWGHHD